jgi:NhaA family Na+:H+ antiporter
LLLLATVVALLWASSPWSGAYRDLTVGAAVLHLNLTLGA